MDKDLINEVMEIKEIIEDAKKKKHRLEGKIQNIMESLKLDYSCDSIKEAKKMLNELEDEHDKLEIEVNEELETLSKKVREYERT